MAYVRRHDSFLDKKKVLIRLDLIVRKISTRISQSIVL